MSFVMEELWQRLPSPRECKRAESIMISCDYPSTIEATGFCSLPNTVVTEIINSHQLEIVTLANLSSLTVITENDAVPLGYADTVVNEKPFCLSRASKN
ncbi:valine--tRNA ligase, mitochondrial 1-like isoform X1 [Glycine soja]|nr:valine--tRNA ligase, mitochondrial 1-like isoform X1 [Glycine soja]